MGVTASSVRTWELLDWTPRVRRFSRTPPSRPTAAAVIAPQWTGCPVLLALIRSDHVGSAREARYVQSDRVPVVPDVVAGEAVDHGVAVDVQRTCGADQVAAVLTSGEHGGAEGGPVVLGAQRAEQLVGVPGPGVVFESGQQDRETQVGDVGHRAVPVA